MTSRADELQAYMVYADKVRTGMRPEIPLTRTCLSPGSVLMMSAPLFPMPCNGSRGVDFHRTAARWRRSMADWTNQGLISC